MRWHCLGCQSELFSSRLLAKKVGHGMLHVTITPANPPKLCPNVKMVTFVFAPLYLCQRQDGRVGSGGGDIQGNHRPFGKWLGGGKTEAPTADIHGITADWNILELFSVDQPVRDPVVLVNTRIFSTFEHGLLLTRRVLIYALDLYRHNPSQT
jgi:hypothetical protein